MSCRVNFLVACLLAFRMAGPAIAAEPVPSAISGLELWLDAEQTGAGSPDAPLAEWTDLSNSRRHAAQSAEASRPRLVKVGESRIVRFDGEDDHLRVLNVKKKLSAFTLFVVAAPHANPGFFRGLFAFNQTDRRDYETGFTLDLNAPFSARLDSVNLEGRGFQGARNLLKDPAPFGTLHTFECCADPEAKRVRMVIDGQLQLERDFAPADLFADEITIGARYYTNEPNQPQQVRGFLQGDIAEVILFSRVLADAETKQLRDYLQQKHSRLREELPGTLNRSAANSESLVTVSDPPAVQMLAPGFSAFELPVDLTNVNNLRYREDGQLYALAYSGDVWLLHDSNGDGLEDTASKFFDSKARLRGPIGMAVIPEGHALLKSGKSQGVVVPSKGKVSAILDQDGDGVAEEERIIASGWKEIVQSVDGIGIAFDKEGAIYFGLGTTDYSNGYLIDKDGKSHYDLAADNGTIQRIEPDLSRRSTVCTGVRFTVGMAVNEDNELFVTDQEGATWMANGNPFDELLHIQVGKHYGFPPRHPRHLPSVIDHPSVFDYGPQHQSTCGMAFNRQIRLTKKAWQAASISASAGAPKPEVSGAGAVFGPEHWRGNVFVCGESRGKLYRTELTRSKDGQYTGRNHLIGCLGMLAVDCCVSPQGDLIVACHSGGPDWGSGPSGKGKLFKIHYDGKNLAQPLFAWPAGPQEVRIAFDRPIDPGHLKELSARTRISHGAYVAAGDRFETFWPGYAVVQMQKTAPRHNLAVQGSSVLPDRKTLVIATAPHPVAWNYAITLPGLGRSDSTESRKNEPIPALPQHPEVDLAYSLSGVVATWEPANPADPGWSGWLPHLDLETVQGLGNGMGIDKRFWEILQQPGVLTLRTQVDVRDLVHPSVQPGTKLDHEWPVEKVRVRVTSNQNLEGGSGQATAGDEAEVSLTFDALSNTSPPIPVEVRMTTGGSPATLRIRWTSEAFPAPQVLPLRRLVLPWAETKLENPDMNLRKPIPELAGGSWGRGRRLFLSEEAGCSKCHLAQGSSGRIGPDLANLIHRDYASVLRDVTYPSFALNPDYLSSIITLNDGRVLTGAIRSEAGKLMVGDKDGKVHVVLQSDVDDVAHSPISIMPEGLPKKLGPDRMKDLLTYLLTEPPQMPQESPLPPPKARTRVEVAAVQAGAAEEDPETPLRQLNLLLVAGAKDHGPGEHDYPAWLTAWSELLRGAEGITVQTAMEWPTPQQIEAADTILFFQKGSWNAERAEAIDAHLARGRGLVYIHWAVEAGAEAPAFAQRIGLASNGLKLKFRHGPLDLGFESGKDHPISRNFDKVHFHDESYWQMQGDFSRIRVLATGVEEGSPQPLFWTVEQGRGRVFVSILGHYSWTFDDPLFRTLLLRGTAWSAQESVDRFNELATIGVKLAD